MQAWDHLDLSSSTATVTVNVTDVDDELPVCKVHFFSVNVSEVLPAAPYQLLNDLGCSDQDNSFSLTYSLEDGDAALFEVNATTSEVYMTRLVDFDTEPRVYDLQIRVSDGNAHRDVIIGGRVVVTAVDEHNPVISGIAKIKETS